MDLNSGSAVARKLLDVVESVLPEEACDTHWLFFSPLSSLSPQEELVLVLLVPEQESVVQKEHLGKVEGSEHLEPPVVLNVIATSVIERNFRDAIKFGIELVDSDSVVASHGFAEVGGSKLERASLQVLVGLIASVEIVLSVVRVFCDSVVIVELDKVLLVPQEELPITLHIKPEFAIVDQFHTLDFLIQSALQLEDGVVSLLGGLHGQKLLVGEVLIDKRVGLLLEAGPGFSLQGLWCRAWFDGGSDV